MLSAAFGLLRTFRGTPLRDFRRSLADWLIILLTSAFCDFAVLGSFWEVGEGSVECNGGSRRVFKIGIRVEIDARLSLRETGAETGWIAVFHDIQFSCLHKD